MNLIRRALELLLFTSKDKEKIYQKIVTVESEIEDQKEVLQLLRDGIRNAYGIVEHDSSNRSSVNR